MVKQRHHGVCRSALTMVTVVRWNLFELLLNGTIILAWTNHIRDRNPIPLPCLESSSSLSLSRNVLLRSFKDDIMYTFVYYM